MFKNIYMREILRVLFTILLFTNVVLGQEILLKHTVAKGETITQIAQKYKTTPTDIYRLNSESQNGIKENQILTVPDIASQQKGKIIHVVGPKETIYGLATKYHVKVEELQKTNESTLTDGLKIGQELIIPEESSLKSNIEAMDQKTAAMNSSKIIHEVKAKESLFSIARTYNVSVRDLEQVNLELVKDGLRIGQNLVIPNKKKTLDGKARIITGETIFHTVLPKETKYSISKKYGITIEQLESQNPEIVNGLVEGNKLAINVKKIKATNENEELMIALAEKQVVIEKSKAKAVEYENLEDKLAAQKEINQKVLKVNDLKVNLKEIDDSKEGSVERLKLVLEANKNIQDILISKLDSLVYTMNEELDELKNVEINDLDDSKRLEKQSYANIAKTNQLSHELKKDLAENRKVYASLMNKAERIAVEENLEYKKKVRENGKVNGSESVNGNSSMLVFEKMSAEQKTRDELNDKLLAKIDSLDSEKKIELKRQISKATFYGREARDYDDKLALVKLKKYQAKAIESQKGQTPQDVKPLTIQEMREELGKDSISSENAARVEVLDNLKEVKEGYYLVLGDYRAAEERDKLIMKLIDSGELNSSFFYNINILSYYVYTNFFETKEEALYEYKQKRNKPLYEKMFVVKIKKE